MTHPDTGATTLGELRASGHVHRSVKSEIRENLLARLRAGDDAFPGMVGFEDTVLPELETALLAGHDLVLLGERGQGKTRLMRTLSGLLDEWSPVVEGREIGDPETVHYGLVPRSNRGIFGLNELPDLAERIQVALFNVLEERDIQIRGYSLRLPLDLLLVATANPEDYTNRGRIITPLKDRFGAEIRTHYPSEVSDEVALIAQESALVADVPELLLEVIARLTRSLRESSSVDQRS